MKSAFLIIFILTCAYINGQDSLTNRLYNEIVSSYSVHSKHIGCYGNLSEVYKKVDTLKQTIGIEVFSRYITEPSVNMKYYAFLELLSIDDEKAYSKLMELSTNKDTINYNFAGQFSGQALLPELLAGIYLGMMKAKYYYGGAGTFHGRVYNYGKRNKRTFKLIHQRIMLFASTNDLSKEIIEDFAH